MELPEEVMNAAEHFVRYNADNTYRFRIKLTNGILADFEKVVKNPDEHCHEIMKSGCLCPFPGGDGAWYYPAQSIVYIKYNKIVK